MLSKTGVQSFAAQASHQLFFDSNDLKNIGARGINRKFFDFLGGTTPAKEVTTDTDGKGDGFGTVITWNNDVLVGMEATGYVEVYHSPSSTTIKALALSDATFEDKTLAKKIIANAANAYVVVIRAAVVTKHTLGATTNPTALSVAKYLLISLDSADSPFYTWGEAQQIV